MPDDIPQALVNPPPADWESHWLCRYISKAHCPFLSTRVLHLCTFGFCARLSSELALPTNASRYTVYIANESYTTSLLSPRQKNLSELGLCPLLRPLANAGWKPIFESISQCIYVQFHFALHMTARGTLTYGCSSLLWHERCSFSFLLLSIVSYSRNSAVLHIGRLALRVILTASSTETRDKVR